MAPPRRAPPPRSRPNPNPRVGPQPAPDRGGPGMPATTGPAPRQPVPGFPVAAPPRADRPTVSPIRSARWPDAAGPAVRPLLPLSATPLHRLAPGPAETVLHRSRRLVGEFPPAPLPGAATVTACGGRHRL